MQFNGFVQSITSFVQWKTCFVQSETSFVQWTTDFVQSIVQFGTGYVQSITGFVAGMGRKGRQDPLDRGWSGGKAPGRKYGAPEAANKELPFENFDSVLLEFKTVFHMTGNLGRVRR